jgi:hypothetical protein
VGDHLRGMHIKCPRCGVIIAVAAANGAAPPLPGGPPAVPPQSPAQVLEEGGLSEAERERLESELEEGERLIWASKPAAASAFTMGWIFSAGLFFAAVICLVIMGILLAQNVGGLGFVFPIVFAAAFIVAGVAFPFLYRKVYERTTYAFTDRRALAWESDLLGRGGLKVYEPAELVKMYCPRVSGKGVGSLIFGTRPITRRTVHGTVQTGVRPYGFFYVPRAREVEKLMLEHLIDPFTDKLYE